MILPHLMRYATAPLAWRSVLLLAAGIAAVAQLLLPSAIAIYHAAPATPALLSPKPDGQPPRITAYPAITEHPLFYPTRRPYVAPKTPEPVASAVPTLLPSHDYTLIGIVVSQGARIALIRPTAGGQTIFAKEGQVIGGWTLHEIKPDRVHFTKGAEIFDLRFASPRWPHS